MLIIWKIRYISRETRELDDRTLTLDTSKLEPVKKAAVELVLSQSENGDRSIVKFRDLFEEGESDDDSNGPPSFESFRITCVHDYFEDENGNEISATELGQIKTGDANTRMFSGAYRPHDIQLEMSTPIPIPVGSVQLTPEEVRLLGYFGRDLQELMESEFYREGPGSLETVGSPTSVGFPDPTLKTSISDDELRSAVTIFRRLYMAKEPSNFLKATVVYCKALDGHPYADWVKAEGVEYEHSLTASVNSLPLTQPVTFTRKRLIDVFLYTQYHHQPDERRQQQYNECLTQVSGKKQLLTFLFLTELQNICLIYGNAGRVVSAWFRRYCEHHKISADVLQSLRIDNPHLGVVEKKSDRTARLFNEQVEKLALELWNQRNCPDSGPDGFKGEAEEQLRRELSK